MTLGIRKLIAEYFQGDLNPESKNDLSSLTSEQLQAYEQFNWRKLGFQQFSDTVIAYAPIADDSGRIAPRGFRRGMAVDTRTPQSFPLVKTSCHF